MNPVTCLIIDDERLARGHLRRLAKMRPELKIVGEAADTSEALRLVHALHPQLLFLDIQMPGGGGFAILDNLETPPAVIFVTAHDQHAIRAFEVNAVDYLLKPVTPERFGRAIAHARLRVRADASPPARNPLRADDIALCEIGHSGHFVAVDRILAIEADGNYTRVTLLDGSRRLARQTLKDWAGRLPPEIFLQLDRSHILNRHALRSVEFTARAAKVTAGDRQIEISLGAAAGARLREILGRQN